MLGDLPTRAFASGQVSQPERRLEPQPLIRGVAVLSFRAYLQSRFGPNAFARTVSTLPAEHFREFASSLEPASWYSTAAFVASIAAARDHFRAPQLPESYGTAAAAYELTLIHRFILRFTSPLWLLQRGSQVWRSYHNTGRWTIEAWPRRIRGTLRDFGIVDGMYCRVLAGWFRRAGEMTGAGQMRVVHPQCRATGAAACVFEGEW
jgi:hypothetical protein